MCDGVSGCADRKGEGVLQHLRRLHRSNGRLSAGEAVRRQRRGQQVRLTPSNKPRRVLKRAASARVRLHFAQPCLRPSGWTELCLPLSLRAIVVRAGEVIPVSSEFTPESERQRLQFLVRRNQTKLLYSKYSTRSLRKPSRVTDVRLSLLDEHVASRENNLHCVVAVCYNWLGIWAHTHTKTHTDALIQKSATLVATCSWATQLNRKSSLLVLKAAEWKSVYS